jgi:hypothetical protein
MAFVTLSSFPVTKHHIPCVCYQTHATLESSFDLLVRKQISRLEQPGEHSLDLFA